MTKKESGVKKSWWEKRLSVLVKIDKMSYEYDARLKAPMQIMEDPATRLLYPQHELSEGFENVNFLKKNDKKWIKYTKRKTFSTGHRKLRDNFRVLRTLWEPLGINNVAHVFLSCEWHSIYSVIFHVQFLTCWFVCFVTGCALRNQQLPILNPSVAPTVQAVHRFTLKIFKTNKQADCKRVCLNLTAQFQDLHIYNPSL